jgi:hypothetical protein
MTNARTPRKDPDTAPEFNRGQFILDVRRTALLDDIKRAENPFIETVALARDAILKDGHDADTVKTAFKEALLEQFGEPQLGRMNVSAYCMEKLEAELRRPARNEDSPILDAAIIRDLQRMMDQEG